jgi:hypothetical protein
MAGNAVRTRIVLQPIYIYSSFSVLSQRRCIIIEVTPLATFIERYPFIILQLPIGSKVVVCNIQSKPKLNGRAGVIGKSSKKHEVSIDRIPVLIEGENGPVQLKHKCIQLPVQNKKPLYRSLQEIRHEHDTAIEQEQEETPTRTMTQEKYIEHKLPFIVLQP